MVVSDLHDAPAPDYGKAQEAILPLNFILCGAPGTGKTYHAADYALAAIERNTLTEILTQSRAARQARFKQYQAEGQIEWVTLHAHYTYEDFVQGLRPQTQAGTLLFERNEGVFKRIADRARRNLALATHALPSPKPFTELFNLFLAKHLNPDTEEIEISLPADSRIFKSMIIYEVNEEVLLYRRRAKNDTMKSEAQRLSLVKLAAGYAGRRIKDALQERYYEAVLTALRRYAQDSEPQSAPTPLQNYVLILDEINRAPLAQVMGELLTLIEEDKRYGAAQGITTTLPSGEAFGVPRNLYIIGTMNPADRHIIALDAALRRRFRIIQMYPREELVEHPKVRAFLRKLNQALMRECNTPDQLIGHGFLMHHNEAEAIAVITQQIIPLLEDWFPRQPATIARLLQEAGGQLRRVGYGWEFGWA